MYIPYVIREGLSGFARAKLASFASVSAMTVALALVGLLFLIGFQAQQVSTWLKQRVGEIDVFIHDTTDTETGKNVRDKIALMEGVELATYVSKERAAQIFRQEFGEGADTFLAEDASFLPASIKVRVRPDFAEADKLDRLVASLRKTAHVSDVIYNNQALRTVQENLNLITLGGSALGLMIILAAVFLVANTIRLTIYARRLLIRTMKLVGATDAFIQKPFLVEGIAQGLVAGLAGSLVLLGLNTVIIAFIPQLASEPWPGGNPVLTILVIIAFGVVLGWLGSLFAVRRFIKRVTLN